MYSSLYISQIIICLAFRKYVYAFLYMEPYIFSLSIRYEMKAICIVYNEKVFIKEIYLRFYMRLEYIFF